MTSFCCWIQVLVTDPGQNQTADSSLQRLEPENIWELLFVTTSDGAAAGGTPGIKPPTSWLL